MAEVRLEDMKPNSHVSKEQPIAKPHVEPIVKKSAVVSTKKSLGQKFVDTFMTEDAADVKSWLVMDVVIPGIKNTILDMLSMMFFGGTSSRSRGRSAYSYDRPSYRQYSYSSVRGGGRVSNDRPEAPISDKVDYRNIILQRRDDAERIVDEMRRRITEYGQVSIAEMLDLMELTGKYTDNNWGWTNPRDIGVTRVSTGYLIDVAEAQVID